MRYFYRLQNFQEHRWEFHFYKDTQQGLVYDDTCFFDENMDVDSVRNQYINIFKKTRELNPNWDEYVLWDCTQDRFRVWNSYEWFWAKGYKIMADFERTQYFYREKYRLVLDASKESVKSIGRFWNRTFYTKDIQSIFSWSGKHGYYSGLSCSDGRKNHKLISLWNRHGNSPFLNSFYDLDDDFIWTRKIGSELSKFLNVTWIDKMDCA